MKRILIVCLALIMVAIAGCGKKEAEPEKTFQTPDKGATMGYLMDPVDNTPVDVDSSNYSYVYKDCEYSFHTKDNMEAFIDNPEKYIKTE